MLNVGNLVTWGLALSLARHGPSTMPSLPKCRIHRRSAHTAVVFKRVERACRGRRQSQGLAGPCIMLGAGCAWMCAGWHLIWRRVLLGTGNPL